MKKGWQVVKVNPGTEEKISLTLPSTSPQAKNSKRRLERIGIENLTLIHTKDWCPPRAGSSERKELIRKVYGLRLGKKKK